MTRQAKVISLMFAVFTLLILSEVNLRLKRDRLSPKYIKRYRLTVAIILILSLISSFYFLTDSLYDFLLVGGLFLFLIIYFFILIKEPNIGEKGLLFLNFGIWIIWFFVRNIMNRHLLVAINYTIIIIFIVNIIQINMKKDKEIAKKFYLVNLLGVFILVLMILASNDSYRGISKQEYIARQYMMDEYGYKKDDIVDIARVETNSKTEKVFISVKDRDKLYLLTYDQGEIKRLEELER